MQNEDPVQMRFFLRQLNIGLPYTAKQILSVDKRFYIFLNKCIYSFDLFTITCSIPLLRAISKAALIFKC